jgi:antitoxin component YwqK of YwqJK toxin-antitoxin module
MTTQWILVNKETQTTVWITAKNNEVLTYQENDKPESSSTYEDLGKLDKEITFFISCGYVVTLFAVLA